MLKVLVTNDIKILNKYDDHLIFFITININKEYHKLIKYKTLDNVIVLSPYTLAYVFKNNINYQQLIHGPGNIQNIIPYIKYYYDTNDISIICNNEKYININILKENINNNIDISKKNISGKKILFVQGNGLVYDDYRVFKNNKEFLKEYLVDGNFIAMFEPTGAHFGVPFNFKDKRDWIANNNRRMIDYYCSLNINPIQVMDFKCTYVGISYDQSSCNLGWNSYNFNDFIDGYLNYLETIGYNIMDIYCYDFFANYPLIYALQKYSDKYNINCYKYDKTPLYEFGYKKILK